MDSTLEVFPSIYGSKSFSKYGRPNIIGYIHIENLKFVQEIKEKNTNFDLNHNRDKAIMKEQGLDVKLTDMLRFLVDNEARLKLLLENNLKSAQFFCYRGLLSQIARTPYENNEAWKIVVMLYKGYIFLCNRKTEEKIRSIQNMTPKEKMFTSWGYKFEQYMLADKPDSEPDTDSPLDENEEFSLVFSTKLNHHRIIFGAEMDGIRCDKETVTSPPDGGDKEAIIKYLSTKKYIELKTSRHSYNKHQETNFWRYKALKWWCQSFFAGIDTIVCGFRNDSGIVENLKVYDVDRLPQHWISRKFWNPKVCLNFLDTFLEHVKSCLAKKIRRHHGDRAVTELQKLPLMTIMFEWSPGSPVTEDSAYRHEDDPILHDWFLDQFGKGRQHLESESTSSDK